MTDPSPDIDWLALRAADRPDSPALVEDDGNVVSYRELSALADAEAARLRDSGIGAGDVALIGVGAVDARLISSMWGAWRSRVAPLVIDQNSPLLAMKSPGSIRSCPNTVSIRRLQPLDPK